VRTRGEQQWRWPATAASSRRRGAVHSMQWQQEQGVLSRLHITHHTLHGARRGSGAGARGARRTESERQFGRAAGGGGGGGAPLLVTEHWRAPAALPWLPSSPGPGPLAPTANAVLLTPTHCPRLPKRRECKIQVQVPTTQSAVCVCVCICI
jgi:hypothetical protein